MGRLDVEERIMSDESREPLALRLQQASRMIGVSPRCLWDWAKRGLVPCKRIGSGRRQILLFSVPELRAWLSGEASSTKGGGQ